LAQEDLMVKREALQVVRDAIDNVGRCDNVNFFRPYEPVAAEKLPEGIANRRIFRNDTLELELLFKAPPKPDETQPGAAPPEPAPPEPPKPADGDKPEGNKADGDKPDGDKAADADKAGDAKAGDAKDDPAKKKEPPPVLSGASKLRNIAPDRKAVNLTGLFFRIHQRNAKGEVVTAELPLEGGKLEADKSVELKKELTFKGFDLKAPADRAPIEVELVTD